MNLKRRKKDKNTNRYIKEKDIIEVAHSLQDSHSGSLEKVSPLPFKVCRTPVGSLPW